MLNAKSNLIDLYLYSALAGKTEIPVEYHLWCCITMMAAAVSDRVWLNQQGKQICNLYTFLVGESASGKGTAIKHMEKIIDDIQIMNAFEFRGSAVGLMDTMSKPNEAILQDGRKVENSKIFIVTPELKDNIGSGPKAEDFAAWATNLWEGEKPIPQIEITRGNGQHMLIAPNLTWLAGTTKKWLIDSVSMAAIQGGFIGRIACVQPSNYSLDNRYYRIEIPKDLDEVIAAIKKRVIQLTFLEGEFTISPKADQYLFNWYMSRPSPEPESPIIPVWKRIPQLVYKLSMILSLADKTDLVIEPEHVYRARELGEELLNKAKNLLIYANVTAKTEVIYRLSLVLKQQKKISKSLLLKQLNVSIDDFEVAIRTLIASNTIKMETDQKGKDSVEWLG